MSDFMQFLSEFVILFLTTVFLENTVFARGFGLSRAIAMTRRPRSILVYGTLLTLLTLLGGIGCYLAGHLFPAIPAYGTPLVYLAVIAAIYLVIYGILTRRGSRFREEAKKYMPVATFNCAVIGGIFLALFNGYELWQFIAIGLGNGVGFVLATLLLLNADRALSRTEAPKAFAGFPLMLIYVGILAMVFYALVGHRLPF